MMRNAISSRGAKTVRLLLVAGLAAIASVVVATPANAADLGDRLFRGQTMNRGDYIDRNTTNGRVQLLLQTDRNLVLYGYPNPSTRRACWDTGTVASGYRAVYQNDGNFVVYNSSGRPVWASNTVGTRGTTVDINASGHLYVGVTDISRRNCP
jgi:hypothetical protein